MQTKTQEEYSLKKSINLLSANATIKKKVGYILKRFFIFFGGIFSLWTVSIFYWIISWNSVFTWISLLLSMTIYTLWFLTMVFMILYLSKVEQVRNGKLQELKTLLSTLVNIEHKVATEKEEFLYISNYDKNSSGIDPKILERIKTTIEELSKNISEISSKVISIHPSNFKKWFHFSLSRELIPYSTDKISEEELLSSYVEYIKEKEQERLKDTIISFKGQLDSWMKVHKEELEKYEGEIESQTETIQNTDWKVTLESQRIRLQSYIESINNLVK